MQTSYPIYNGDNQWRHLLHNVIAVCSEATRWRYHRLSQGFHIFVLNYAIRVIPKYKSLKCYVLTLLAFLINHLFSPWLTWHVFVTARFTHGRLCVRQRWTATGTDVYFVIILICKFIFRNSLPGENIYIGQLLKVSLNTRKIFF